MIARAVAAALFAFGLACLVQAARGETLSAEQIIVIDGDTIDVAGKRWRLMGFDTPETYYARCAAEMVKGKAATARLVVLIGGAKAIELQPSGRTDRYRRGLGVLRLDGVDVAETMIKEGHARPYHGQRREGWCD